MTRPQVLIAGAGFAGLSATRRLAREGAEVTLVDRHLYSTFQPLLYQVATGGLNPGDVAYPVRGVAGRLGVRFRRAALAGVDPARRTVTLDDGSELPYDYLLLATGVTAAYFGVPGAAEHSAALYTRPQAIALRDELMSSLERVAAQGGDAGASIVVVGGGATGVEMAGTLAELRNVGLPVAFPEIDRRRVAVVLVEQGDELLTAFHPRLRRYTLDELRRRHVDVRLNTSIEEVGPSTVRLSSGEELRADLTIWGAGVTAPAYVADWGLPQGRGGRIVVRPDLRVEGQDRIFVAGDLALTPHDPLPQVAQPAIQGGAHVAEQILRLEAGEPTRPFRYRDKGNMATIGRRSAIAELPFGIRLRGTLAWLSWLGLHIVMLLGNRNRVSALLNLTWRYLAWPGGAGMIVGDVSDAAIDRAGRPRSRPPASVEDG